jgi:acyl-CoA synthetase (AMP-forming)/AMP-acid ligase II
VELLKRWTPKARILTPYGATECLPISLIDGQTILNPENRALNESGQGNCVGKPLPGIDLKIIPPSDQTLDSLEDVLECRHDEIGEIIVRGDVVTKAYDKLEEETKLAKIPDGNSFWHRMGDLGYLDKQGHLWYCGRIAHMVETSRGPLYSVCVEAIFNKHPQVYRSALVYLGSKHPPHVPAVVVELENGEKPDPKILSIELQKLGAQHSNTRPIRNFYIHPSFPVDVRHNAKIHRIELSKWAAKQDPLPSV